VRSTNTNAAVESHAEAIQQRFRWIPAARRRHIYNTQSLAAAAKSAAANASGRPPNIAAGVRGGAAKVLVRPTATWVPTGLGSVLEPFSTAGWITAHGVAMSAPPYQSLIARM